MRKAIVLLALGTISLWSQSDPHLGKNRGQYFSILAQEVHGVDIHRS
jgi:hypothetical protein